MKLCNNFLIHLYQKRKIFNYYSNKYSGKSTKIIIRKLVSYYIYLILVITKEYYEKTNVSSNILIYL